MKLQKYSLREESSNKYTAYRFILDGPGHLGTSQDNGKILREWARSAKGTYHDATSGTVLVKEINKSTQFIGWSDSIPLFKIYF